MASSWEGGGSELAIVPLEVGEEVGTSVEVDNKVLDMKVSRQRPRLAK